MSADEGNGDEWPAIRTKLVAADILVMGTPIWLGAPSSSCKRVVERLDAMLGETDDVGYTIPASGSVCWVGEAMGSVDYKDLPKTPDAVASALAMTASNAQLTSPAC